jgi:DNA-3-methyladenine glycosylase I
LCPIFDKDIATMSYCLFCNGREESDAHRVYHENHYGFPIQNDDELFGRLILEINQAGLSWGTILNKQHNFRTAFDNYSIVEIAKYDEVKIQLLLINAGIIRNQLKIRSVIHNAQQIEQLKIEFGSFKNWLDINHPKPKEEWTKLFKKTFKFVGGEIVNEFLMSTGYLKGAHDENCIIFDEVKKTNPKWLEI